jgi:hypothetical protein
LCVYTDVLFSHITRTRIRPHLKQPEPIDVGRPTARDITSHETHGYVFGAPLRLRVFSLCATSRAPPRSCPRPVRPSPVQSHLASPSSRTPCTANSRCAPPGVITALASGVVPRATAIRSPSQEYHRPGSTAAARRALPKHRTVSAAHRAVSSFSMSPSSPCHAPQPSTSPTIAAHRVQRPR